jgi:hypothetical protein
MPGGFQEGDRLASAEAIAAPREWDRAAAKSKVALTPTAWSPEVVLGMREWADHGHRLGVIGRGAGWWIGDWVRYGNERFGERYVRASRITGYDVQTLMNMVYVASRFEPHQRRESLSWSHHAELAAVDPGERERWLDLAETQRLSVRCLREEMRRARRLDRAAEADTATAEAAATAIAEADADAAAGQPDPQLVCPECGCKFAGGS